MKLGTTFGLLVVACRSSVAAPSGCIPANIPADVVVQITRSTLPIAGNRTEEAGAVTVTGHCAPKIACKQIDAAKLSTIWSVLLRAATIDHGPPSSPHYGGRWIDVTWKGGSCELADSQHTPVTQASAPRFDAAFAAVAKMF